MRENWRKGKCMKYKDCCTDRFAMKKARSVFRRIEEGAANGTFIYK